LGGRSGGGSTGSPPPPGPFLGGPNFFPFFGRRFFFAPGSQASFPNPRGPAGRAKSSQGRGRPGKGPGAARDPGSAFFRGGGRGGGGGGGWGTPSFGICFLPQKPRRARSGAQGKPERLFFFCLKKKKKKKPHPPGGGGGKTKNPPTNRPSRASPRMKKGPHGGRAKGAGFSAAGGGGGGGRGKTSRFFARGGGRSSDFPQAKGRGGVGGGGGGRARSANQGRPQPRAAGFPWGGKKAEGG